MNPYLNRSLLNLPLQQDICQQIHYTAIRASARGSHVHMVPDTISLIQLRQRASQFGPSIYLSHPTDVQRVFEGITTAIYQAIEELYCSRLERSIQMIWRILAEMAGAAGKPAPSYEVVW